MENTVFREDRFCSFGPSQLNADCFAAAERALRASQPVGFVVGCYDDALTVTDVSEYFLENLGYTYEEFMQATGGSLRPLFYGENQSFLAPDRWPGIQGAGDGRLLTKDGLPLYARLYKDDAVDAAGRPVWVLAAKVDWTQQNLSLVNSVIQSGLWYIDYDEKGRQTGMVYSHEFRVMLGYHDVLDFPNEISSWEKLIHPADRARVLAALHAAAADETGTVKYDVEYRMKMPDGSYQWFRDSAEASRRLNGTARRMVGIFVNVDKRKRAEAVAEQASSALKDAYDAANRANRAKTEFLSNMSHDIRTPMNAIVGMTAIARANIGNQERVVDCLGKITQASRHLLALVNEVLDMSRIESGKVVLTEEEFNLGELVDNLVTMAKPSIEEHHHHFEVRLEKIEHEAVCGDSLRIQQMVTNILSNAIKYTPDGGHITFSLAERPTASGNLGCYEFMVEDDGVGMTPEFQKVLFEPFTRADDQRTSKIQGTGLGMAIARNIVNMMNGTIKVDSAPGKGSKFTVTIFLKRQDISAEKVEELADLSVLVVDDDELSREGAVEMLEEIGIDAEAVSSGPEAVERTVKRHEEQNDFFAILMDWQMPGMDGITATRKIRSRVGRDVPIIVLTAYDYAEIEEEARAAGVNDFIAKPLFRSRLTAALKNLVDGRPIQLPKESLEHLTQNDFRGKNILLVEDNALNREIAQELIEMTGASVETAENGQEAVDVFAAAPAGHFDLIFMDIQMPQMNGYQAAAAIRSLPKGLRVPIVAMTANAFAEDVILAKNAGMNEHLAKPLDLHKLNDVLNRWL